VDRDLVTDEQLAAVEWDVEAHAPVLAVDLGGGLETDPGAAPRVLLDAEERLARAGALVPATVTPEGTAVLAEQQNYKYKRKAIRSILITNII